MQIQRLNGISKDVVFKFQGAASIAGGQTYNLPNGQSINIAYNNGFSYTPGSGPATSQGSSISVTKG